MDKNEALNIATQYANVVSLKYESARFFMFGSWAKGNPHKNSDIDIAIIMDNYETIKK